MELHPSKGYGFVEFVNHGHALAALRQLNNNPTYSGSARSEGVAKGETSRLIVEFSVENHAKLKLQQVHADAVAYVVAVTIPYALLHHEAGSFVSMLLTAGAVFLFYP